jgi:hypothetical protein
VTRLLVCLCLLPLAGCEPLAISLLGTGATSALRYTMWDGVTYRTFTAAAPQVKQSTLAALERMGIKHEATLPYDYGEIITANTPSREIYIEVEPISERATRVRIAAKNGSFWYDNATASEIVAQTERLLVESAAQGATRAAEASNAVAPAKAGAPFF